MADYFLSKRAQRELANALAWSLKRFGPTQATDVDAELRADFLTLAETPNPGTPLREKRGTFWLPCGSYVIFYRVQARRKRALIDRILYNSQLPSLL